MISWGRILRDIKETINYPRWVLTGRPAPDNHLCKRKRIREIQYSYDCDTFIETGTFYGQMVYAVRKCFSMILSVELSEELYALNKTAFSRYPNVRIFHGDSSDKLEEMCAIAKGRALFWLDGHYSGEGTALGAQVSPIIKELDIIGRQVRNDHCILIDDARLFTGNNGYPKLDEVVSKLKSINVNSAISINHDCIINLPTQSKHKSI